MATRMRAFLLFVAAFTVGVVLLASHNGSQHEHNLWNSRSLTSEQNRTLHRKLFNDATATTTTTTAKKRAKCSKKDIVVVQGPTKPQPNGIPTHGVQITNTCATGCAIANIHLSCGSFSSAILIDPNIFKRLANNDCLVNGGKPLAAGFTISFEYATSFQFPLSVSTVTVTCQTSLLM